MCVEIANSAKSDNKCCRKMSLSCRRSKKSLLFGSLFKQKWSLLSDMQYMIFKLKSSSESKIGKNCGSWKCWSKYEILMCFKLILICCFSGMYINETPQKFFAYSESAENGKPVFVLKWLRSWAKKILQQWTQLL